MKISDLDFITKQHSAGSSVPENVDVNLTVQSKGELVYMSFSNKARTMLGTPKALIAAKSNDCLFLCEQDEEHGYKFTSTTHRAGRRNVTFPNGKLKLGREWAGFYPIRYDKESGLFYIALKDKEA